MPEPAEAKSCPVLEALQAATEEDLAVIDTKIRDLEGELESTTERIKGEVTGSQKTDRTAFVR